MPVLTLNLEEINFLAGAAASYALVAVAGELLFLDARCPHRGGPLHLGWECRDARGRAGLACPWHGTFVPIGRLRRASLPMVWCPRTGEAAVMLPPGIELTPMLRHPHAAADPATNAWSPAAPCVGAAPEPLEPFQGAQP